MKYKYVLFDLDGTILDSHEGLCKSFQAALRSYGVEESIENIKDALGPLLSHTIIEKYGFSKEDGANAMKIHGKRLKEKGIYECKVYEDIPKMLKTLKANGIKLAIATNKPEEAAVLQLKYFGLIDYFDLVCGNNWEETRGLKDDFIRMAMKGLNVKDKSQVCIVGDRYNDIEGGNKVGIDCIAVTYGYGSLEEIESYHPKYIVSSVMGICDIILN